MKNILISAVFLFSIRLHAMQHPDRGFLCEEDSNGDVWVNNGHGGRVKETYNDFFYSLAVTKNKDDTKKHFSIPGPLFVQLCVQASKIKNNNPGPFQQLLTKIREGAIELDQSVIGMTHRDAKHRLLSYIPKGKVNQLVNGKKIRMTIIVGTRVVERTDAASARTTIKIVEEDFPIDPADLVFPEYGQGQSSRGRNTELTRQDRLSANYDFLSDAAHHQNVVVEFKASMQSKID
ncbi:hypothetical protein BH09DEP1_BH09DEP1_1740 [soil metagenome]